MQLLASQPWSDKTHRYFLTREQEYVGGLQAAVGIWKTMRGQKLSIEDGERGPMGAGGAPSMAGAPAGAATLRVCCPPGLCCGTESYSAAAPA